MFERDFSVSVVASTPSGGTEVIVMKVILRWEPVGEPAMDAYLMVRHFLVCFLARRDLPPEALERASSEIFVVEGPPTDERYAFTATGSFEDLKALLESLAYRDLVGFSVETDTEAERERVVSIFEEAEYLWHGQPERPLPPVLVRPVLQPDELPDGGAASKLPGS